MARVSVIIPAYNAEATIEKCLRSLAAQTFRDFDAIVVDDGSRDRTAEIAADYAKVVRAPKNLGVGGARNLGAQSATGEILAYTDSDVVLPPGWLERIVRAMRERSVRCVGGGYCGSVGGSFLERFSHLELVHRRAVTPEYVSTLVANNFACDREVFLEAGGFPLKYTCEDLRLSFKISRRHRIYWDRENGVWHHFRSSLKGYLKQQYHFAKDTVWSYFHFPGMLFTRTHQGRGIYGEVALLSGAIAALAASPWVPYALWAAPALALGVAALNLPFLGFLRKEGLPALKSLGVIYLRDLVCIAGILAGIALCLSAVPKRLAGIRTE